MDEAILRLMDANANRAREGLRVMEDHARFVLDDAAMSERIKQLRHHVSTACAQLPAGALAARDVAGDVGREISTPQETRRDDATAVATAAARRVTEALRCLEEYGKCLSQADVGPASRRSVTDETPVPQKQDETGGIPVPQLPFEAMRYQAYELEQQLLIGGPRRLALRRATLHVLITESLCRGDWRHVAREALAGGAGVLQLREKTLGDRDLLDRAMTLRAITREAGALLIINDRPDIARLCDADGVHVGQDDLPVEAARRIVGVNRIVGVSTHNIEQFRAALATDADYIAVGPMFASRTKPQDVTPGPALLAAAVEALSIVERAAAIDEERTAAHAEQRAAGFSPRGIEQRVNAAARNDPPAPVPVRPLIAIGGITSENVAQLTTVGGRCVAVCGAVIGSDDPRTTAAAMRQTWAIDC